MVKRYDMDTDTEYGYEPYSYMTECLSGAYVKHEDYERLVIALQRIKYAFAPGDFAYQIAEEALK